MLYNKISGFSDEISSEISVQFEVLNKLSMEYFEPRGIEGKNIADIDKSELDSLCEKMKKHGIHASSVGSPIGKIKITEDFAPHFEKYKKVVETAKTLNAKYIRMFSFYADGEWTSEKKNEVFDRIGQMIIYAKKNDVVLLHENEKDIYGDTKERCVSLFESLACDNFKAVFDFANFVQCGEDPKEAFNMLKPYIEYIHIKDSKKDGTVVPAGMGEGNIEFILGELFKSGYDGFISLEPHLGAFEGLADLEIDDKMLDLPKGGEGTFTLAYNSLESIIDKILKVD